MKILAIGNSFSQDATAYLHDIATADGFSLTFANLMFPGCSLQQHVENALSEAPNYSWEWNGTYPNEPISLKAGLLRESWDYITLQQASHFSFRYDTYQPYLTQLATYVRKWTPNARLLIHQTWAYAQGSERLREVAHYEQASDMLRDIVACYARASAELDGAPLLPSGEMLAFALTHGLESVHRDTFHASIPEGRYLLAGLWYTFLTGRSLTGNSFLPEGMQPASLKLCQEILEAFWHQRTC